MSAVARSGGEYGPVRMFLGHWSFGVSAAFCAVMAVTPFLPLKHNLAAQWAVGILYVGGVLIYTFSSTVCQIYHDSRLCLRCMRHIWGPEQVDQRRTTLQAFHRYGKPAAVLGMVLFGLSWVPGVGLGFWVAMCVLFIVTDRINFVHSKLRPWCPYCKPWDDDGEEEIVPDPVPTNELELR
jgi:hypothetical protein